MLEIRKKGHKNFVYYSGDFEPYTASDLTIFFYGNIGYLRSQSGKIIFERKGWSYNNITIYDDTDSGTAETFASVITLTQRLIDLGCPAYYTDSDIVVSNLISNQSGNILQIGDDGLLYIPAGGTSGVNSVAGDGVDNTDPSNPVLAFPNLDQVQDGTTYVRATPLQLQAIQNNTDAIDDLSNDKADKTNVLELNNATIYTPTSDYHPSTKKYVDDTKTDKPITTADTGTVISLANQIGNFCNMASANATTTYTTTGAVTGGQAVVLINASTEPTVTGATKISGSDFEASTDMEMYVRNNGTTTQYFFNKL